MKPSDIYIGVPPLTATMRRTERECAAAMVLRTLQVGEDTWSPVTWMQILGTLKNDEANRAEPFTSLLSNPFCRPDFRLFADGEFGRWTGAPGHSAIEFTARGVAALVRHSKLNDARDRLVRIARDNVRNETQELTDLINRLAEVSP